MKHITYKDTYFTGEVDANNHLVQATEIHKSKVYGTYTVRYPSGIKTMIKVWNTRLNKMVSIHKDTELVEVID
jgi:hypothetical protein